MNRALKAWSLVIASALAGCGSSYEALDSEPGSQRLDTAMNEPETNDSARGAEGPPLEPPSASGSGTAGQGPDEPPDPQSAGVVGDDAPAEVPGFESDILDCGIDQGYEVLRRTGTTGGTEVHVFSVYESTSGTFYTHPTGEARVEVSRSVPVILVLASYEATSWTVVDVNAQVELVVLAGYYAQTLTAPEGVAVIDLSGENGEQSSACGYGEDSGGCDTPLLLESVEQATGEPMTSFAGCYHASTFVLTDASDDVALDEPPTDPIVDLGVSCGSTHSAPFQPAQFVRPDDELSCDGAQYVTFLEGQGLYLGVQLCGEPTTYRLYLAEDATGPFLPATDTSGNGQDQCELLNPDFTLPNSDDITSGGCSTCNTSQNLPLEGQAVFNRDSSGECFQYVPQTGIWSYQTSRLSCGVSIP